MAKLIKSELILVHWHKHNSQLEPIIDRLTEAEGQGSLNYYTTHACIEQAEL